MSALVITDEMLRGWVLGFFWPLVRITAMLMVAPLFGSKALTPRARLMMALTLTLLIAPLLPPVEPVPAFSAAWFKVLLAQLSIGLLMGFVLQLVFEAVVMAGELIGLGMGLSFAQLADPMRGVNTGVLGQLFLIIASLFFLTMGGHLVIVNTIVASFQMVPVGPLGVSAEGAVAVLEFGTRMFLGGLQIALPAVISLMLVNLAFGVISRAAPALNPIAVGFPITLTLGLIMLQFTLNPLVNNFSELLADSLQHISQILEMLRG